MKKLIPMALLLTSITHASYDVSDLDKQAKLEVSESPAVQIAIKNISSILGTLSTSEQKELLKSFKNLNLGTDENILLARGGSSTGGGSGRTEKFKAYAHMYATYLQDISDEDREKYGITATADMLRKSIIALSDNIFELEKGQDLEIFNEYGEVIAEVKDGLILENGNQKDAYFGVSQSFKPGQFVIFLSRSWQENDFTLALKEYLRALNLQNETSSILDYFSSIEFNKIELNESQKEYKSPYSIFEDNVVLKSVKVEKVSVCNYGKFFQKRYKDKYGKLPKYTGIGSTLRSELGACAMSAAVEYAARMCEKSYETAKYWSTDYKYAKLTDFKIDKSSCGKKDGQLSCEKSWSVTCEYYYKSN